MSGTLSPLPSYLQASPLQKLSISTTSLSWSLPHWESSQVMVKLPDTGAPFTT